MIRFEQDAPNNIKVYQADYIAAELHKYGGVWVMDCMSTDASFNADELRRITQKLDELNSGIGVELLSKD